MTINDQSISPPRRLFISGWAIVFLSYFSVGYQNSVLNTATDVFLDFINSSYISHGYSNELTISGASILYSVIVSLWQVGCIFGSLAACVFEAKIGSKRSLLTVASSVQIIGSFVMVLAPIFGSFELLALGRLIAGFSTGIVCPTLRVFLCECCPNAYRGYLNAPGGFVVSVSSMIAVALAQPSIFGTSTRVPFLLGVCIVPSIVQLLISPCIPPSPKYLYIEKGNSGEAVKAIFFYHGPHANVPKVFREYELERRLADDQLSLRKAIATKSFRIPLILSAVLALAHSSTGIDILEAYSTEIFASLGMDTLEAKRLSLIFNVPGMIGGILAIFIADRVGRRPLLICTMGLFVFFNLLFMELGLISGSYGYHWAIGTAAVTLSGLQAFVYGLGPGALAEVLFAEFSPQNVRAVVGSSSEFCFWFSNSIFVFGFPPLLVSFGAYSFLLFTIPLIFCMLYLGFALPETAGKSVVEVVDDFGEDDENGMQNAVASSADFLPIIGSSASILSSGEFFGSGSSAGGIPFLAGADNLVSSPYPFQSPYPIQTNFPVMFRGGGTPSPP